jgi:cold shock protein
VQHALGLEPGLLAPFSAPVPAPSAGNGGGTSRRKLTGTVKFFNSARGYGFVEHQGGEDLFVHHSQVKGDARNGIAPGSTVEFTIGAGRRGDEAQDVKVLRPTADQAAIRSV